MTAAVPVIGARKASIFPNKPIFSDALKTLSSSIARVLMTTSSPSADDEARSAFTINFRHSSTSRSAILLMLASSPDTFLRPPQNEWIWHDPSPGTSWRTSEGFSARKSARTSTLGAEETPRAAPSRRASEYANPLLGASAAKLPPTLRKRSSIFTVPRTSAVGKDLWEAASPPAPGE